jgi:hypothetical protein
MARLQNTTASEAVAPKAATKRANKKTRTDAKPSARERSASKPRDEKKTRTAKREELNLTVEFKFMRDTKNKAFYVELDDNGDAIENPFGTDCTIGQIYISHEKLDGKPPKKITVTISE